MNKFLFLTLFVVFFSCKNEITPEVTPKKEKQTITISGFFENIGDLTKITLHDFSGQQHNIIAETYVKNNSFSFEIPKQEPVKILTLGINGLEGYVPLIAHKSDLVLRMNLKQVFLSDVSGDPANDAFSLYKKEQYKYQNQISSISELAKNESLSEEMKTTFNNRIEAFKKTTKEQYLNLFNNNLNNFTSGLILEDLFREQIVTASEGLTMFEKLPQHYKNTPGAQSLYRYMVRQAQGQ